MLAFVKDIRRRHLGVRILVTTAALLAAFAFQIPVQREVPGEPFLLFVLVVMAAALLCGEGVGLVGVVLSALLSAFFFEPGLSMGLADAADYVKIELYALLAAGCAMGSAEVGNAWLAAQQSAERLSEQELKKTILLKEVAHRVANNFAAVATLIRSQSIAVRDEQAKSVLDDALGQIMVMARIHKRLHAADDEASLDSESFIGELCDDLQRSIAYGRNVSVEAVAISRELPLAHAVPLGLILNELVTNAIKYAFPVGQEGRVRVCLREVAGLLELSVEDNGVGIVGETQGSGLGHHLTQALARQLEGKLCIDAAAHGTVARLTFPRNRAAMPLNASSSAHVFQASHR